MQNLLYHCCILTQIHVCVCWNLCQYGLNQQSLDCFTNCRANKFGRKASTQVRSLNFLGDKWGMMLWIIKFRPFSYTDFTKPLLQSPHSETAVSGDRVWILMRTITCRLHESIDVTVAPSIEG